MPKFKRGWERNSLRLCKGLSLVTFADPSTRYNISCILHLTLSSSSSSCRTASTDIRDPLSPLLLIIHRF